MSAPKPKLPPEEILRRETEAAKILVAQITESGLGEDSDLIRDMVEGETNLQQAIERTVASIVLEDEAQLEGLAKYATYIADRKRAVENRIERKKAMLMTALQISEQRTVKTALKTISLKAVPPKLNITDESAIPSNYWKPADPTLDRKGVTDYLKARAEAIENAAKIEDAEARARMFVSIEENMPPLTGAELTNGSETIAFR